MNPRPDALRRDAEAKVLGRLRESEIGPGPDQVAGAALFAGIGGRGRWLALASDHAQVRADLRR